MSRLQEIYKQIFNLIRFNYIVYQFIYLYISNFCGETEKCVKGKLKIIVFNC